MTDMNSLSGNHTKVNDDLSKRSGSSWSKEEDEFLRDNYAKLGPKIVGEKLGRTRSAVRTRAHEIGASSKQRFKEWSDEEDEFFDDDEEDGPLAGRYDDEYDGDQDSYDYDDDSEVEDDDVRG